MNLGMAWGQGYYNGPTGNYKTWTLDWTGLNYGLTRKMLKLFSIAFYSVVSATKFM